MPNNDTLFVSVDLAPEDQAKLRTLQDKEISMQRFVQQMMQAGEKRAQEITEQGRALWTEIAAKYKLDIEHINYVPSEDFTKLVPKMVKL